MAKAAHDNFEDHQEITGPSDRSFGLTVGGILVAIGLVRWFAFDASQWSTLAFVIPGTLLVLLGLVQPQLLSLLNKGWMKLGLLLAMIVNPIVMALMFVVLFIPIGLIMKIFGRDALRMKRPAGSGSYWIERNPPGPAPETLKNQF
ncbi:MAG: SxtJ family membrane protein [Erythrobacter sp.]|uniref:SxtJ family membrane protein n=1 Tax=Erythrobacter sp. TaxID=1042 RepID=UPI00260E012A|nr:SxtJ family membrane protein [Erythrobacter sp.]MDJ0978678.1 SxtJ family membrane protein [Erythrobacter sp.]